MTDKDIILKELSDFLSRASDWADPSDLAPDNEWSPILSTMEAVKEGNLGLALTRWDDLLNSPNRPKLSHQALEWQKMKPKYYFVTLNFTSKKETYQFLTRETADIFIKGVNENPPANYTGIMELKISESP